MSLQNPNNVVTEERLAQFYQQILPYLGGMPDVLANKFNRADLYSTDEKLIGRWIDGKPLYQKVVSVPSTSTVWGTIYTVENADYLKVIQARYYYGTAETNWINMNMANGNDTLILATSDNNIVMNSRGFTYGETHPVEMILQYTKTTDSAVEIGDDTDYSTTEKIVGTWIDGKPIYQKTITGNTGSGNHSWNINVPDMEQAISISGYLISGELSDTLIPVGFYSNATNGFFSAMVNATDKTILLRKPSNYDNKQAYITIQYTKTSS